MSYDEKFFLAREYVTKDGGLIARSAQIDTIQTSIYFDPARPDNYWIRPGSLDGMAGADNSINAPNPHPDNKATTFPVNS